MIPADQPARDNFRLYEPPTAPKVCGWCGHPNDCTRENVGTSRHHGLCCADQRPSIHAAELAVIARIMREDTEDRWSE